MANKVKSIYVCSECGYESVKWYGKCPGCNEWNTMNEEIKTNVQSNSKLPATPVLNINDIVSEEKERIKTGIKEFDRVLGGGIVGGSLMLLSGDPGIGKSTILLQICNNIGQKGKILYVSGEESANQIKLRDRKSVV